MTATLTETSRLSLRLFALADLDEIHSLVYGDPEVAPLWTGRTWSFEEVRAPRAFLAMIARDIDEPGYFAIERAIDGRLLGLAGVHIRESDASTAGREAVLACALGRIFWRRGYASEACRALIEVAFDQCGVTRLVAPVSSTNQRGITLLRRLGFRFTAGPAGDGEQLGILDAPEGCKRGSSDRVTPSCGDAKRGSA